jgi:hypothetical protein
MKHEIKGVKKPVQVNAMRWHHWLVLLLMGLCVALMPFWPLNRLRTETQVKFMLHESEICDIRSTTTNSEMQELKMAAALKNQADCIESIQRWIKNHEKENNR